MRARTLAPCGPTRRSSGLRNECGCHHPTGGAILRISPRFFTSMGQQAMAASGRPMKVDLLSSTRVPVLPRLMACLPAMRDPFICHVGIPVTEGNRLQPLANKRPTALHVIWAVLTRISNPEGTTRLRHIPIFISRYSALRVGLTLGQVPCGVQHLHLLA